MTGRVAEDEKRRWLTFELSEEYLHGSKFRWEEGEIKLGTSSRANRLQPKA